MKRGESYGGGQSSLGYLFSSDEQPPHTPPPSRPTTTTTTIPPYGVDNSPETAGSDPKQKGSGNYPRAQGQNSGNFITDRPSTKVKSVPGGDSSLGYLFGDK